MRAFKFVKDPGAWELMADDTRRRVVYLLRAKEMTVGQIAEQLQKTPRLSTTTFENSWKSNSWK